MKKIYLTLWIVTMGAITLMAQTVSSSTVAVKYCKTSYSAQTKHVCDASFPMTWEGLTWESGGTQVAVLVNARGCDSVATYTLNVYTPCSKPFTVSASGQKVYFSRGNLQYLASLKLWRFALDQWGMLGAGGGNATADEYDSPERSKQSKWIDLFGYGTSGKTYDPWRHTIQVNYYPHTEITGTDNDWGIYNNAALGNPNPTWRTPTKAEWDYLINTRTTKRGCATVNDVQGLVLLPDDWTLPDHCTFDPNAANYTTNVYSTIDEYETWRLMEVAGAVFLPVTGLRSNDNGDPSITGLYPNSKSGYYWATDLTIGGYSYNPSYTGYWLEFNQSSLRINFGVIYDGRAVRLIRNE